LLVLQLCSQQFDSIVVGYHEGMKPIYMARVRNGFTPASREALFKRFHKLEWQQVVAC